MLAEYKNKGIKVWILGGTYYVI